MRRARISHRTIVGVGAALLIATVSLVGVSGVATARRSPTLSFSPTTPVSESGQGVLVNASRFKHAVVAGGLSECNVTPGEPTIPVAATGQVEPVGCQAFSAMKTRRWGALRQPLGYGIMSGVLGPPVSGTDSAGTDAAVDAANYPCPPTAAQISAGGQCELLFATVTEQSAEAPIAFDFESTTTTSQPAATNCTPESATATSGASTMTVNPATCLVGNQVVSVSGSGFQPDDTGVLQECNTTADQPTILAPVLEVQEPVSCSAVNGSSTHTTTATGTLPQNTLFVVLVGAAGPPASGTDSAGTDAAADAGNYPSPPTPAQQQAGSTCVLTFGDNGGDRVSVPLSFAAGPPPGP